MKDNIDSILINSLVYSKKYGYGIIDKVEGENEKLYVIVLFFKQDSERKTIDLMVAINNGSISFLSEEIEIKVKEILLDITNNDSESDDIDENKYDNSIKQIVEEVLNHKPIAIKLIEIMDDDLFEYYILNKAFSFIERKMNGRLLSSKERALVIIALSLIALKKYDGDLHSYFEEKYREYKPLTEKQFSRSKIQKTINEIIGNYREYVGYFDSQSYVAVPIVLSCVPHYRVPDLFKISYDIYKKKLLFDEDVTKEQIFDKVSETLQALKRKELINNSDLIIGTNYLMSKYTQSCIYSGFGFDELSLIIVRCIQYIISYLTKPEDSFTVENYYFEGYESWVKLFEHDEKEKERYTNNRAISRPFFRLKNNSVYLVTGKINMDDKYNPNDVHIYVYCEDDLVDDILLDDPNDIEFNDSDEAIGGYTVNRREIRLSNSPLGELNYSIFSGENKIYNSRDRLFRKALFFDGKGNEVRPGTKYDGELFVVSRTRNDEEYENNICLLHSCDDYYISALEVNSSDIFRIDNEPYVFYKIQGAKVISYDAPWSSFISSEGKEYCIYSDDITILFQASCDPEEIDIEVDGQNIPKYRSTEICCRIMLFSSGFEGNWAYTVRIFNLDIGFHKIRIYNSISGKLIKGASFEIIYDSTIWKRYIEKNEEGIKYEITSSFIDTQDIFSEYGNPLVNLRGFVKNLGYGDLRIHPSSISYSYNGDQWYDIDKKLFLSDIDESEKWLRICGPEKTRIFYYLNADTKKRQEANVVKDSDNIFLISLDYIRSLREESFIKICFEFGNRIKYLYLWFNPFVLKDESKIYFDKQKNAHIFDVRFEGKDKLQLLICPLHTENPLLKKEISSGEIVELSQDSIPKDILYVTVSLCGKKYGGLFESYSEKPFFSFSKYPVQSKKMYLKRFTPFISYDEETNNIIASFVFNAEKALIKIYPVLPRDIDFSYNKAVFTKTIHSGEKIKFDTRILPLEKFLIFFYLPSLDSDDGSFEEYPIYKSKPINTKSQLLRVKYDIVSFILDNDKKKSLDYSIYLAKPLWFIEKYYIVCKLINNKNQSTIDDVLISKITIVKKGYKAEIKRKRDDKLVNLKIQEHVIEEIIIR